ncbi:MAG: sugar phosphate nucleotidyltransferase [Thermodesulfobacteriota bacterium]
MRRFAVIMAGGSGERFWPASRRARPKQLLRLTDPELSMLEEAIERIAPLIPRENIVIATSELLAEPIAAALPSLPRENVLAEPEKRNTAACLALAAAHLERLHGDPADMVMAVLTADHQIGEPERFRATVARALDFAATEDALVTIGVVPTRPETGYGYIEVAPSDRTGGAAHGEARAPLRVVRFREKPDEATAETYAKSGRHYWNSGMFFWRVSTFLHGLTRHMGDLAAAQRAMVEALASRSSGTLREAFLPLADVSVDVGLMERADNVWVVPADFPWDDVGAWDALERTRASDGERNVVEGDAVLVDVHDSIVFNEAGEEIAVALVGVDKVIVAITRDGVLVCSKDRAQDVRRAVAELRKRGRERFT